MPSGHRWRERLDFIQLVERAGMDENDPICALVAAAHAGDQVAWNDLVDRYTPLLISVIRRFRMSTSEAEDVAQTVWLRLVEHLGGLREPRALPMWLITTGKRESLRYLSTERRTTPQDPLESSWNAQTMEQTAWASPEPSEPGADLLAAERRQALLAGLGELNDRQRQLLSLLVQDPPLSYAEISDRIGIPVGAIGPTRARALDRLRQTAPVLAWMEPGRGPDGPDRPKSSASGPKRGPEERSYGGGRRRSA